MHQNMNKYFNIMRKFFITLMMMLMILVSCGTTNYVSRRTVNEMDQISYVLANYYPQLHEYFLEGVMTVDYLKEIVLEDGTLDYKLKYHFTRYYYRNEYEITEILKNNYPELYDMYVSGVIEITSLYRYVEKRTGKMKYHISYRRVYDYYYHYYPRLGGTHIYYRPRPIPPMRQSPPPPQRKEPNVRPNNSGTRNPGGNRPPQGGNGGRR